MSNRILAVVVMLLLLVPFQSLSAASQGTIQIALEPSLELDETVIYSIFRNGVSIVSKDGKYGLVDSTGSLQVPFQYDGMATQRLSHSDMLIVTLGEKQGVITVSGEVIVPIKYDRVTVFSHGLAAAQNDSKWGYLNEDGQIVIDFIFDEAFPFAEERALVKLDNKYGYINTLGEQVVKPQYDDARQFTEGLAWVSIDNLWGAIDLAGVLKIELQDFSNAPTGFWSSRAVFTRGLHCGLMDTNGDTIVEAVYSGGSFGIEIETAIMSCEGKQGVFDLNGEVVVPFDYDSLSYLAFTDQQGDEVICYPAKKDDLWGILDSKGQELVVMQYDQLFYMQEGLFKVFANSTWSLIDHNGTVLAELDYDIADDPGEIRIQMMMEPFSAGYAPVSKDGKYGFINSNGELVVPLLYDVVANFNDGLCWVKVDGKYGILQIVNIEKDVEKSDKVEDEPIFEPAQASVPFVLTIDSKRVLRGDDILPDLPLAPFVLDGQTMLPFRYLIEALLEGTVAYDAVSRAIEAGVDGHIITIIPDSAEITIDGETYDIEQMPLVLDGVTFVSLTAIEQIVTGIVWDEAAQTMTIIP